MPALGRSDAPDRLAEVMTEKLTLMRRKHAQTREYMEMNALRGIVKDGAGTTLYNYFTEFGLEQISVDFVFGTAGTNIQGKVRNVLRAIEDNLLGETMTTAHALVSSEFFDKLISHPKTEEAYRFFSATGGQPLREDMRRAFPFAGILFEEYNGSVTLSNGTSERLIPTGEGIAFPLGTFDTFTTYGGPANLLETANTVGLPLYARQMMDARGRWIDLMTEASILPVNKRPRLAIRCTARTDGLRPMSVFAAAIDNLFADPNIARDAVYIADGGPPVLIRVVTRCADEVTGFGEARLLSETTRIDLRAAEVPAPRPGDRIEIDGEAFHIQGEPVRDRERLVWTVDLRPA